MVDGGTGKKNDGAFRTPKEPWRSCAAYSPLLGHPNRSLLRQQFHGAPQRELDPPPRRSSSSNQQGRSSAYAGIVGTRANPIATTCCASVAMSSTSLDK